MRAFEYKKSVGGKSFVNDRACNCIGPQDGQPLCPCAMRGVKIKNGRYVMPERDLGPAPKGTPDMKCQPCGGTGEVYSPEIGTGVQCSYCVGEGTPDGR